MNFVISAEFGMIELMNCIEIVCFFYQDSISLFRKEEGKRDSFISSLCGELS
jgi:hypothetical protein